MNGTNGKQSDFPDVALVPYPVIVAATKGDPDAMKIVLQHFSGYIASLSMRKLCDERGNVYFGVDEDIRQRLQARLMRAILTFRVAFKPHVHITGGNSFKVHRQPKRYADTRKCMS